MYILRNLCWLPEGRLSVLSRSSVPDGGECGEAGKADPYEAEEDGVQKIGNMEVHCRFLKSVEGI